MKLRRVYETAEEEGKSVEEVALERYGSREAFEEALEERRILDERADKARPQQHNRGHERNPVGSKQGTPSVTKVDLQVKTPSDVQARVDRRRHPLLRIHSLNPTLQLIDASTHYVLHQMRHPQAPNKKLLPGALQLL